VFLNRDCLQVIPAGPLGRTRPRAPQLHPATRKNYCSSYTLQTAGIRWCGHVGLPHLVQPCPFLLELELVMVCSVRRHRFSWTETACRCVGHTPASDRHTHNSAGHTPASGRHTHNSAGHTQASGRHTNNRVGHTHASVGHVHNSVGHTRSGMKRPRSSWTGTACRCLHTWIISGIEKQHLVQNGRIDGPTEYLS